MPVCKKCNTSFPNRVKINGRTRNISRRKYCLDCSPFGAHNTRQIENESIKQYDENRICQRCKQNFTYNRKENNTKTFCSSCYLLLKRTERKKRAVEYLGGKCEICGYNRCMSALDFHHKSPDKKEFAISTMYYISWNRIEQELDKCMLVCKNCHAEIHQGNVAQSGKRAALIKQRSLVQIQPLPPKIKGD